MSASISKQEHRQHSKSKSSVQTLGLVVAAQLIMPRKCTPIAAGGLGVFEVASVKLTPGGES